MAHRLPTSSTIDQELSFIFHGMYSTETSVAEQSASLTTSPISATQLSPMIGYTGITPQLVLSNTSLSSNNTTTDNTLTSSSSTQKEYQSRTLRAHTIARLSILPMYPSVSQSSLSSSSSHLLLTNVPIALLTDEQYARIQDDAFPSRFKLEMDFSSSESFLLCLYQQLYIKIKHRLKIDIPIIDFNLTRLRCCLDIVVVLRQHQQQTMLNMDELPLALEYYLQFDVDMFYLKTCSFNGVQPRRFDNRFREGVFCIDTPEPRFAILPCHKRYCQCCHTPTCPRRDYSNDLQQMAIIPFSNPHIHRFVNQYEAILNCPATCETKNCIYVLTCLCGQVDFVGQSQLSFAETLDYHYEEGNRIMREFLLGEHNIQHTTLGLKSDEKKANDKKWCYQHSTCCSISLQHFLDYNPGYWCFVPMKSIEVNIISKTNCPSPSSRSTTTTVTRTRSNAEVHELIQNIPQPPLGFNFSMQQRQQQADFFKYFKDYIIPRDNVHLYNADIIAILPDHSSELFGQLIESLFITHAECKLNEIGHLIYENVDPNRALQASWCANLTRRPN